MRQQLLAYGVHVEELGGDVKSVEISALNVRALVQVLVLDCFY